MFNVHRIFIRKHIKSHIFTSLGYMGIKYVHDTILFVPTTPLNCTFLYTNDV